MEDRENLSLEENPIEGSFCVRSGTSSPLQLNLNLPILWVYQVVLLVDPFVGHDISKIDNYVPQRFLIPEK